MRNARSIARARRSRRDPPAAEARVWTLLRDRRFRAFKVRRQHAIGPYVVDFCCVALRLVIEVDGPSHTLEEQAAFDAKRTASLESWGWRVARIDNAQALASTESLGGKLDAIFCEAQTTPLPREGERSSDA
jgi:very-short-patch-repair endonuclease